MSSVVVVTEAHVSAAQLDTPTSQAGRPSSSSLSKWHPFSLLPERLVMVLLCAVCTCINYADRVNISVAIISMAEQYSYTIKQQSVILSSFFLGYIPMNIGGAVLSRRYGAKIVLSGAAVLWSLFTILTPISAAFGFIPLLLCRVLMGLAEGMAFPTIFHFLSAWVPAGERARSIAICLTGVHAGTTIALVVSPLIIKKMNWQSVFHIFGFIGFIWIAAWHLLARDRDEFATKSKMDRKGHSSSRSGRLSKSSSPSGSMTQLNASAIGATDESGNVRGNLKGNRDGEIDEEGGENESGILLGSSLSATMPTRTEMRMMRVIITDKRMASVCLTQCMFGLVHYTILSWLPTYFKEVYGTETGSLSFTCAPYASMALSANIGGWIADALLRSGMGTARVRKVITAVSCTGSAIMLLVFTQMQTVWSGLAAISLAMSFKSLNSGGFESAFFDISIPSETGLFKAVANTLAAFSGLVAVPLSTLVLDIVGGSWRKMFATLAGWYVAMGMTFCLLYTGERFSAEENR